MPENFRIVVSRGGLSVKTLTVGPAGASIGQDPDSDIVLVGRTISPRHAALEWRQGRVWVRDLGSVMGTFHRKARVPEALIEEGEEFRIGSYALRVTDITRELPALSPHASTDHRVPTLTEYLLQQEKRYIETVLAMTAGDSQAAARLLGLTPDELAGKLDRFGVA